MLLYHFTAANRLDRILAEGLTRGDVPTNGPYAPGDNAVWFTDTASGEGHGLGELRQMTDAERLAMIEWRGTAPAQGARWDDKREVRIKVRLPSSDRALRRFLPWARRRFDHQWLETLVATGGGVRCAERWWLYFGEVRPSEFVEVAFRDAAGRYAPFR